MVTLSVLRGSNKEVSLGLIYEEESQKPGHLFSHSSRNQFEISFMIKTYARPR